MAEETTTKETVPEETVQQAPSRTHDCEDSHHGHCHQHRHTHPCCFQLSKGAVKTAASVMIGIIIGVIAACALGHSGNHHDHFNRRHNIENEMQSATMGYKEMSQMHNQIQQMVDAQRQNFAPENRGMRLNAAQTYDNSIAVPALCSSSDLPSPFAADCAAEIAPSSK